MERLLLPRTPMMKVRWLTYLTAQALVALAASGCGARSQLSLADTLPPGLVEPATDGGGAAADGGGAAPDGVAPPDDPCPGVLAGAPKPMARNCSTRDGRARVAAPRSPHVTWTLPRLPLAERVGFTLVTDASDRAYLLGQDSQTFELTLRRIDAAAGVVTWSSSFATGTDVMPTPFLLQAGRPEVLSTTPNEIATFDVASGTPSVIPTPSLNFGLLTPDPAIGADGNLYLLSNLNGDGSSGAKFAASRVGTDGTIAWTSAELSSVATPARPASHMEGFPNDIALGTGGTVLVEFNGLATPYAEYAVVIALDPATGHLLWERTIDGQPLGGLVVASDGSIAIVAVANAGERDLVVLEATGETRRRVTVPSLTRLCGAARDGTLLAYLQIGGGIFGVAALDAKGNVTWQKTGGFRDAFLASNGTAVAFGDDVRGLDLQTGETRWSVASPSNGFGGGVCDAALTSGGKLVAVTCDGTPFGAED